MTPSPGPDQGRAALASAFGCYVMWGLMPLLFMGQHAAGFDALVREGRCLPVTAA